MVDGQPVALTDIRAPIFAVGTETDHVAPWRSVYKFRILADTDVTFLLTTGGHNAGIVAGANKARRSYRVASAAATDTYVDPETWLAQVPQRQGILVARVGRLGTCPLRRRTWRRRGWGASNRAARHPAATSMSASAVSDCVPVYPQGPFDRTQLRSGLCVSFILHCDLRPVMGVRG